MPLINVLNSQSPDNRANIVNSVNVSRKLDLTVYNDLKGKCDKFSNCAGKLQFDCQSRDKEGT